MYQFIELSNKIASENMPGAKVIYFIRIFKCVRSVPKLPICIFYRCLPESNLKTIPSLNMNIFIYLFLNEKKLNSSSGYFEKKKKIVQYYQPMGSQRKAEQTYPRYNLH